LQRYLDFNATCPPVEASISAWNEAVRQATGNASSVHWAGRAARRILDDARDRFAVYVGASSDAVVFTSGGTESNNMAIHGWLADKQPGRIVASSIEHPSVLQPLERLASNGWDLVLVPPDNDGVVCADAFLDACNDDTRLACLMAANNETGAVQPVAEVGHACRGRNIPLLVDAVQLLGKAPLDVSGWRADFVSFSAHKIGGPKGVGALILDRTRQLQPLMHGGGQERGRRSGTENVPGVAGFAAALDVLDFRQAEAVRNGFEARLLERVPGAHIFSHAARRLPNTSMFSLPDIDGETLLMQLDLAGFAVASGSACSSGLRSVSHVLMAMGCSEEVARNSVRVSFGPGNTLGDATALLEELATIRDRLQAMAGAVAYAEVNR
jgi:cysteine desulfurase